MVKQIVCFYELMHIGRLLSVDLEVTMKVSSTYLLEIHWAYSGGQDMRACCSRFSMYRLAMTADTGFPMAAPSSCSCDFPLYVK